MAVVYGTIERGRSLIQLDLDAVRFVQVPEAALGNPARSFRVGATRSNAGENSRGFDNSRRARHGYLEFKSERTFRGWVMQTQKLSFRGLAR